MSAKLRKVKRNTKFIWVFPRRRIRAPLASLVEELRRSAKFFLWKASQRAERRKVERNTKYIRRLEWWYFADCWRPSATLLMLVSNTADIRQQTAKCTFCPPARPAEGDQRSSYPHASEPSSRQALCRIEGALLKIGKIKVLAMARAAKPSSLSAH